MIYRFYSYQRSLMPVNSYAMIQRKKHWWQLNWECVRFYTHNQEKKGAELYRRFINRYKIFELVIENIK